MTKTLYVIDSWLEDERGAAIGKIAKQVGGLDVVCSKPKKVKQRPIVDPCGVIGHHACLQEVPWLEEDTSFPVIHYSGILFQLDAERSNHYRFTRFLEKGTEEVEDAALELRQVVSWLRDRGEIPRSLLAEREFPDALLAYHLRCLDPGFPATDEAQTLEKIAMAEVEVIRAIGGVGNLNDIQDSRDRVEFFRSACEMMSHSPPE